MATSNKVLMEEARKTLEGKWKLAVKATALTVLFLIATTIIIKAIVTSLIGAHASASKETIRSITNVIQTILITGPMAYGSALFFLFLSRGQKPAVSEVFKGFHTWLRCTIAYLRMGLFIMLWALLLIIPGIIAAYSYSQMFYIMVDDQNISAKDAMAKSKEMMKGNKWKLFYLGCRFIGWGLLAILTLGIGFLWLMPYVRVSMAKFYEDVSGKRQEAEPSIPEIQEVPVAA